MYVDFTCHELDKQCKFYTGMLPPDLYTDEHLFESLWKLHPQDFHRIMIHGRWVKTPRWQQAYDKDYYYTKNLNKALPLPSLLNPFLEWSKKAIDSHLNGVLVNWYEGFQKHYIGKHQDSTIGLIDGKPIVTISLGQTRTFRLRYKLSSNYKDFIAENRGVFIMPYETNEHWTHEVPHFSKNKGQRISITLRAFL
jgi:alkylated DNA repair dioxygenase AlkB